MIGAIYTIAISLAFLVANLIILLVILALNKRQTSESRPAAPLAPPPPGRKFLEESDILGWEFEYARTTASEAMQDRHTMMNFYLVVVAVVISGAVAVLGRDTDLPKAVGTVLLWLLVGIGWFYFLMLIRLRQS